MGSIQMPVCSSLSSFSIWGLNAGASTLTEAWAVWAKSSAASAFPSSTLPGRNQRSKVSMQSLPSQDAVWWWLTQKSSCFRDRFFEFNYDTLPQSIGEGVAFFTTYIRSQWWKLKQNMGLFDTGKSEPWGGAGLRGHLQSKVISDDLLNQHIR